MKKTILPILLMISQPVFAGFFSSDLRGPCLWSSFNERQKDISAHKVLLSEYRRLTGKEFGQANKSDSSAGILTGGILCPIAAGVAIASGGFGIAGPLLFCGKALALGAAADGMANSPLNQAVVQVSPEKQKRIDELTQKLKLSAIELQADNFRHVLLFQEFYGEYLTAFIENTEKVTGQKLDRDRLRAALATMRASKTTEFCPNNQPMNFSEITAELLKRYDALSAN